MTPDPAPADAARLAHSLPEQHARPAPVPVVPLADGWCLRPWRDADAPSLARHANNVNVWRNMAEQFPHPYTLEAAQEWVTRGQVDFGGEHWAIALDDVAVGGCGLHPGAGDASCAVEIGYWLGEPFWGRGVATRVVRVLSGRALALPGVVRVYAGVHTDNRASMRVLEKSGFEREGVLRKSALKAGAPIDRVIYARIRTQTEG